MRMKAYLEARATVYPYASGDLLRSFHPVSSDRLVTKLLGHRWICSVSQQASFLPVACLPARTWIAWYIHGVNHSNLSALRCATRADAAPLTRMALVNVRSLVNKTFVLNDFFSATSLDALFLTETWIRPGESLPFSERLPSDCVFF